MDSRKKKRFKIYLLTSVKKLVILRSYSQQRGWKVKTHQGPKVCREPNEINPDKGTNWTVTHMGSPQPQNRKLSAKVWLQILPSRDARFLFERGYCLSLAIHYCWYQPLWSIRSRVNLRVLRFGLTIIESLLFYV